MKDFERDRAVLSHDKFKNGFLISIAYSPENSESGDRNIKLIDAINGDEERRTQIRDAFAIWDELSDSIKDFLENLPSRYGFVVSQEFRDEKSIVMDALQGISDFITRFLNGSVIEVELSELWRNLDITRELLERMGYDRKRYVLDYDPLLVKE